MTAPSRETQSGRLERAGYVHLSGWVPAAYAKRVQDQIDMHREDVEKIKHAPARRPGRPRKTGD